MKNFLLVLLSALLCIGKSYASGNILYMESQPVTAETVQADTTLTVSSSPATIQTDYTTKFEAKKLILPAALITIGAVGATDWLHSHVDMDINKAMNEWRGDKRWHGDDYIQYLPAVAHLGLGLCGVKAKHSFRERFAVLATSAIAVTILTNGLKYTVKQARPTGSRNSFPSGHTAVAFMGAELVRLEYRDASPWYGIGAYTVATGVAFMRLYNNRHWLSDVIAGAGFGILSANIGYWLLPLERKLFRWDKNEATAVSLPFYDPYSKSFGASLAVSF